MNSMINSVDQVLKIQNNISFINKLENVNGLKENRSVVFLCVGNSKIWYDAFGPYVGTLLQKMGIGNYVYGNIRSNILLSNIDEFIDMIYKFHSNPYIIVVDSAISDCSNFDLCVKEEKTVCGAFSENPVEIGDLKISCLIPAKAVLVPKCKNKLIAQIKRICFFIKYVFC